MADNHLLPCPFCGGAARIESNRDWHRIFAAHDDDCVLDADEADLMYPAQPGYLIQIAEDWNRRPAPDGAPTAAQERPAAVKPWHDRTEKMDDASIIQALKAEVAEWRARAQQPVADGAALDLPPDPFANVQKFGMAKIAVGHPDHYPGEFIRLRDARAAVAHLYQRKQGGEGAAAGPILKTREQAGAAIRVCNALVDIVGTDGGHPLAHMMDALMSSIGAWEEQDPELRAFFDARKDAPRAGQEGEQPTTKATADGKEE